MPLSQVANIGVYSFGAPATAANVLRWRVVKPGKIIATIEAASDPLGGLQFKVSSDGTTFVALGATGAVGLGADFSSAITLVAFARKTYEFNLRNGKDLYLDFLASGGCYGNVQIRGDAILEPRSFSSVSI